MTSELNLDLVGDGAWDMTGRKILWLTDTPLEVACLAHGTEGGHPTVALRIDLDDEQSVVIETTMRLFLFAADAMRARFCTCPPPPWRWPPRPDPTCAVHGDH